LGGSTMGWVRDADGHCAFFTDDTGGVGPLRPFKQLKPLKPLRQLMPLKGLRQLRPIRPLPSFNWSDQSGPQFFRL
jgi:hypothetical protein